MNRKTSLSCPALLLAAGLSVSCLTGAAMADETVAQRQQRLVDRQALLATYVDQEDVPAENLGERAVTCQPTFAASLPPSLPANCVGLYGAQGTTLGTSIAIFQTSDTTALQDLNGAAAGGLATLNEFAAENFVPATSGVVDGLCFYGRYLNDTAASFVAPPATNIQTFRVRYFNDGGGFPCGTPIAEFRIGALSPTAGTSVTRVSGAGTVGPTGTYFRYTLNHPNVPVTAGTCHWVEIVDDTPGTEYLTWVGEGLENGGDDRHALTPATRGYYSANDALITFGAGAVGVDLTLCISLNMAVPNCPVSTTPPANDAITSAQALTIPTAATPTNNVAATLDAGPSCLGFNPEGHGVWYSVIGNGSELTFSTDGSQCHDTVAIVYDATAFNLSGQVNDLVCVGSNDDISATDLDSLVTWCSGVGTSYLIYVGGLNSTVTAGGFIIPYPSGEANFSFALSSGADCTTPDAFPCEVVQQITDIVENDACGATTDTGCGTATAISVGDTVFGTMFATWPDVTAPLPDFDFYSFTLGATTDIDVTIEAESAMTIAVLDCATNAVVDIISIAECVPGPHLRLNLPAGVFGLAAFPFSDGGIPCDSGWHEYRLTVAETPVGACCTGTVCTTSQPTACNDANGTWLGDAVACASTPCDVPCVTTLGTPAEAEACLADPTTSANNTCATANSLTLGTASFGTLSTADGTPAPGTRDIDFWAFTLAVASDVEVTVESQSDALVQVLNCPAGTVVDGFFVDKCTTVANALTALPAGDYAVLVTTLDFFGSPCGGGTNNYSVLAEIPGPACPPDFTLANFTNTGDSAGQIDVIDLFDFLDAWFAQTGDVCMSGCSADVVAPFGGSPDVTDLFDFLDAWFATNGQVCP